MKKSVLSVMVPALLLMSAAAFADEATSMSASSSMSASKSMNSSTSATVSGDISPTYLGGRKAYRSKSRASLDASEAQITAQLNQQLGVTDK